ncbi:DUF4272 domain-containing protein [Novosphingobium sp.]|uniref:DUF4272 domain-containing protein n=1 Tax=Novosphingobium sp. TaxID=1874826 RepID=UPI003B523840
MDHEAFEDEIRSPREVAFRALGLFSVVGLALGADRSDILDWLTEHDLWQKLSASEIGFVDTLDPSRQQLVNISWLSERLVMILWALGAVDALPPPDEQCNTALFQEKLPPFALISVSDFVTAAQLRSPTELIAMADDVLGLHWEARDARHKGRTSNPRVDMEIIQERHHAINWVIGYDGLDWDDVTTDT